MSQNQEIIEAKLCAFIDGELDPEGRAEIEKHLEANPQHRRLLESLRATRDLVRWLPREQAPSEIAETLNGQLERSVLLDYGGDPLRPSIWPRLLAAAAIVALTLGLAAAVFYALPKSPRPLVASRGAGTNAPGTTDSSAAPGVHYEAEDAHTLADQNGQGASPAQQPANTKFIDRDAVTKESAPLTELAQQVAQNPAAYIAGAAGNVDAGQPAAAAATTPLGANALMVFVRSDNPMEAEQQLTSYLTAHRIQFGSAEPVAQDAMTTRAQAQSQVGLAGAGGGGGAGAAPDVQRDLSNAGANSSAQRELAKGGLAARWRAAGAPETQPAAPDATAPPSSDIAAVPERPGPAQVPPQGRSGAQASNDARRANNVYVARMSRRQAEMLSNSMINDAGPTRALNNSVRMADPAANNARQRRGMSEINEQLYNDTSNANAGNAISLSKAGEPTTHPGVGDKIDAQALSRMAVGRDQFGAANQASRAIDRLPAAQARDRLSTTQPANGPRGGAAAATVQEVRGVHRAPEHRAEEQAIVRGGGAMTAAPANAAATSSTRPSDESAAAGTEATPATQPAPDEPVDVVILVQPNDTAAPATQPAEPPAATAAPTTQPSATSPADAAGPAGQ